MLQLFKNNHFLNSLLLLPLTVLIHMSIFFRQPVDNLAGAGYLGREFVNLIDPASGWGIALYLLLVFLQATLINRLVVMHRLGNQITLIPGFLWIIFSAFHPQLMGFSAASLSVFFLLIGMNSLFKSYQKRNAPVNIFNTGLFLGLSSLIYYPLSLLLIFGLVGLYTVRNIRQREVNQYMIGWITPYFLVLCYVYVFDNLRHFIHEQWTVNFALFSISGIEEVNSYPFWLLFGIIMAVCLLNYSYYFSKKIIYAQKKISILFIYLIFVLIPVFFVEDAGIVYALLFLWPLSYFFTESLNSLKNQMLSELFTWLIIIFSFFMQYQTIL